MQIVMRLCILFGYKNVVLITLIPKTGKDHIVSWGIKTDADLGKMFKGLGEKFSQHE